MKKKKVDLKLTRSIENGLPVWNFDRAALRAMTIRDIVRDLEASEDELERSPD